MDDQVEDSIAVGSTGTLLSLMGKEMEILQARKSCSVAHHLNKRSPSAKGDPCNTISTYASTIFGSPSPSFSTPPPPSRIVSSLWSDLKGLLRSPTSVYHSPLFYHNNFVFWKEDPDELSHSLSLSCHISAPPSPASPRTLSPSTPTQSYPKEKTCPNQTPSRAKHPKEKVATDAAAAYFNQKSSKDERHSKERSGTGAADKYPNRKSSLYNIYPKERSVAEAAPAPYPNWKTPMNDHSVGRESADAYPNQVSPRPIYTNSDQGTARKENRPNQRSLTEAGAAAAGPHLKCPTYPKQKVVQEYGVFAMSTRKGKINNADQTQKGKLQEEARASSGRSRKRCSCKKKEERMVCMQYEYCVQWKREERVCMEEEEYSCMKKREERECMLQIQQSRGGSRGFPSFKSSRPFGGRSLAPVSVVDLQCCHTIPLERPTRRLSFTRLSSFS